MKRNFIINAFVIFNLAIFLLGCTDKASKYYKKGVKHYKHKEYQLAIENMEQSLSNGGDPKECNYVIGEAYRRSNRMHESVKYYQKAVDANTGNEDAYFYYGQALKSVGEYENAEKQFKNYLKNGSNFDLINRAKKEIANLDSLEKIRNRKSWFKVYNIEQLNTEEAEYSPYYFDDKLFFTSSRGAERMHHATGTGFTQIYEFIFDGMGKFSGQVKMLPEIINTHDAHEATCVFTKDGNTMIFARSGNGSKKGIVEIDLFYVTRKDDGTWTDPALVENVNDPEAWDSNPALSQDGKTLYFASNREGGLGGNDIYKSTLGEDGKWSTPENVGAPINTRGNELFPYENYDGTFFFSSDGHPTFGQLDIFKVVEDKNKNKHIYNIGTPINSSYDDFAIFFKDSTTGFFTSNREDGKGDDDIYEFIDESKMKFDHYVLEVTTYSLEDFKEKLLPKTTVYGKYDNGDTLFVVDTDGNAFFKRDIEPDKKITLIGHKEGYWQQTPGSAFIAKVPYDQLKAGDNVFTVKSKVVLAPVDSTIEIVIDNIYYDYDKADIRTDAAVELDKVVELLKNNPDITIELGSHTDERGSDSYNRRLAQARAESAVKYLITKGIDKERLIAKGYGEDKPIIKNAKTDAEHQRNRRTSFRITSMKNDKVKIIQKGDKQEDVE